MNTMNCEKCRHHDREFDECKGNECMRVKDDLAKLIDKLEAIDDCCFASYTLCLIKEKIEEIRSERK